jgi:hypothetical protein
MLVWDEDAGEWVEQTEASSGETAQTGLETPDWANTGDLSNFNLSDITKFFSGKSPLGVGGQLLGLGGIGALLNKMMGGGSGGFAGYQGGIPHYTASRTMNPIPQTMAVPITQQNPTGIAARRPGSGGITYFSPMQYTPVAAAPAATTPAVTDTTATATNTDANVVKVAGGGMMYGTGGIASLGGYSDGGQLLRGPGDGVSDDIPATIGGRQPARLADGEFVVPARIVSELGNGSTDAGARKLYAMMDRIKATRAKAKNIAANTKADKHLPA